MVCGPGGIKAWMASAGGPWWHRGSSMCRNIKTLHNFEPPATARGGSGLRAAVRAQAERLCATSRANEIAFNRAVDPVVQAAHELLDSLVTSAPPRDRAVEVAERPRQWVQRLRARRRRRLARDHTRLGLRTGASHTVTRVK